ncbi:MAG TPA: sigma-70 family RNA polymerase sigma factor [Bacteroidia bacterium]|nr:sigma-70 family RNA polymerase sigma factor [Bacteroidia bacterium]
MEELNPNLTTKAVYDYNLVRKALDSGDQNAFAELMHRYHDSVHFMLNKMVNNKEDADDLTIETFSKAFKNLHLYTPTFAFSTWLFKIASNHCIDHIRRKKHNTTFSIDRKFEGAEGESVGIELRSDGMDPEQHALKKEKIKMMHDFVNKLKPRYRTLIELRYFEELKYEEIVERTGLSLGTVKAQLFRAKELLYNILRKSGEKF